MISLRALIISLLAALIGGGLLFGAVWLSVTNPLVFSHIAAYVRFGVSCIILVVCLSVALGQLFGR